MSKHSDSEDFQPLAWNVKTSTLCVKVKDLEIMATDELQYELDHKFFDGSPEAYITIDEAVKFHVWRARKKTGDWKWSLAFLGSLVCIADSLEPQYRVALHAALVSDKP